MRMGGRDKAHLQTVMCSSSKNRCTWGPMSYDGAVRCHCDVSGTAGSPPSGLQLQCETSRDSAHAHMRVRAPAPCVASFAPAFGSRPHAVPATTQTKKNRTATRALVSAPTAARSHCTRRGGRKARATSKTRKLSWVRCGFFRIHQVSTPEQSADLHEAGNQIGPQLDTRKTLFV